MHPHVDWRNCIDDYCITHLDKKKLELWDYTKPVNFEQVWKQQLREEQRYTKPSPPTPKPKVHEQTFHPKHTFRLPKIFSPSKDKHTPSNNCSRLDISYSRKTSRSYNQD